MNLEHRKAKKRIRLIGGDGAPLANQDVTFKQSSHEFLFGCGAFDSIAATAGDEYDKPAYLELKRLIHEEWHSEGVAHTDANGYVQIEGFKGGYDLTCGSFSGAVRLSKESSSELQEIVLK